jgi:hypothetical protein
MSVLLFSWWALICDLLDFLVLLIPFIIVRKSIQFFTVLRKIENFFAGCMVSILNELYVIIK